MHDAVPATPFDPAVALRAGTRHAHAAMDAAFADGLRDPDDYRRYLRALLALAEWLDASWRPGWPAALARWRDPGRVAALRADLAAQDGAPADASAPRAPNLAAWLGGCYVIEGSAMGARLLVRDLAAHPRTAGRGPARSFLDGHLADPGRWRRFRQALAGALAPADLPAALRGARQGFALVAAVAEPAEVAA